MSTAAAARDAVAAHLRGAGRLLSGRDRRALHDALLVLDASGADAHERRRPPAAPAPSGHPSPGTTSGPIARA